MSGTESEFLSSALLSLTEPYNITLLTFWVLHVIAWCVLCFLRKEEPFASRHLPFTIVSNVGGLIMITVICIREQDPAGFSCALYIVLSNAFVYLYGWGYIVRAVWLYFKHSLNKEICEYRRPEDFDHRMKSARYRWSVVLALSVALAVHVTVVVVELLLLARGSGRDYLTHGCWLNVELEIFLIQYFVYLVVMIIMITIIIKVSDAYWISTELKLCMFAWILFGGMFFLFTLLPQLKPMSHLFPQSSWILIAIGLTFIISDILPIVIYLRSKRLVKQRRKNREYVELGLDTFYDMQNNEHREGMSYIRPVSDSSEEDIELQDVDLSRERTAGNPRDSPLEVIIDNPKKQAAFRDHLMGYLNVALFQFCCDVRSLQKTKLEGDELLRACKTVYNKYLAEHSSSGNDVKTLSSEIKIQANIIHRKLEDQKTASSNMFDPVYNRVRHHMETKMLPFFFDDRAEGGGDGSFYTPYRLCC